MLSLHKKIITGALTVNNLVRAFLLLLIYSPPACSQNIGVPDRFTPSAIPDTVNVNRMKVNRLVMVSTLGAAGYAGGMAGLYQLWYKQYGLERFHFFNDNNEWLKMDKLGHVGSAYQVGLWAADALTWTGLERRKAVVYGSGYAYLFQTTIEVFDGFSGGWGFSAGDQVANTLGAGMLISQELLWDEQRFRIRFSSHASPYANVRPGLLGDSPLQRVFKDYNGQTYWLAANIACWLKKDTRFPVWIDIAAGYGAEGMTGGSGNPLVIDGKPAPYYQRYQQFYLAPDIDLTKIPTKSKVLNTIFNVIGFLKVPMPTLEYNSKRKFVFHPIYF